MLERKIFVEYESGAGAHLSSLDRDLVGGERGSPSRLGAGSTTNLLRCAQHFARRFAQKQAVGDEFSNFGFLFLLPGSLRLFLLGGYLIQLFSRWLLHHNTETLANMTHLEQRS